MEAESNPTGKATPPIRQSRRLGWWFVAGFLLVFVAVLLLVPMTAMHPSGQFAVKYRLWQYYLIVVPRTFGPSTLGPASDSTSALAATLGQHLLVSFAGGSAAVGLAWWLCKRDRRKSS